MLYGSDEDDSSPSEDSKTPASLTSSAQYSGDLGQPQKKKKKVSPSSLAMPVTGPAAQSCKVICCNKMQGKRQTIARSFDELTSHIRSILNGSDANDGLLEDWAFIGMLFSLEILLPEDVRLHKDKQLLNEELSVLESLSAQITRASHGTHFQVRNTSPFLDVLQDIKAPLL